MVRQARSEATRRRILDAAVELFSEVGFAATSLGDIVERAELTKGALYYHFDSKESLASAVIEETAEEVFDTINTICSSVIETTGLARNTLMPGRGLSAPSPSMAGVAGLKVDAVAIRPTAPRGV